MANKNGNRYALLVFAEPSFGGAVTDYATPLLNNINSKVTIDPIQEQIETNIKTGTIQNTVNEILNGRKHGEINIEGAFVKEELGAIFQLITDDTSSAYTFGATNTPLSYEVHRYDLDTDTADIVKGVTAVSLEVSGEDNGILTKTLVMKGKFPDFAVDVSTYLNYPSTFDDTLTYIPFTDILVVDSAELDIITSCVQSLSFSLERESADDNYLYCGSTEFEREIVTKITGSANVTYTYDDGDDFSAVLGSYDELTITNTGVFNISLWGKYTEGTLPEPERQLFTGEYTLTLGADDKASELLNVTVS